MRLPFKSIYHYFSLVQSYKKKYCSFIYFLLVTLDSSLKRREGKSFRIITRNILLQHSRNSNLYSIHSYTNISLYNNRCYLLNSFYICHVFDKFLLDMGACNSRFHSVSSIALGLKNNNIT